VTATRSTGGSALILSHAEAVKRATLWQSLHGEFVEDRAAARSDRARKKEEGATAAAAAAGRPPQEAGEGPPPLDAGSQRRQGRTLLTWRLRRRRAGEGLLLRPPTEAQEEEAEEEALPEDEGSPDAARRAHGRGGSAADAGRGGKSGAPPAAAVSSNVAVAAESPLRCRRAPRAPGVRRVGPAFSYPRPRRYAPPQRPPRLPLLLLLLLPRPLPEPRLARSAPSSFQEQQRPAWRRAPPAGRQSALPQAGTGKAPPQVQDTLWMQQGSRMRTPLMSLCPRGRGI